MKNKKVKLSNAQIEDLYNSFVPLCAKMSKVNSEKCDFKPKKKNEAGCICGECLTEFVVKYMESTFDVREK